ncbi:glycoside hydrolase family 5 protein [Hortaea werneckii]|nr:glycoside hydrolase family 5 protein [Hortaea werneckii]
MVLDPRITPFFRRRDGPAVRVEVIGAEIDILDRARLFEVGASGAGGVRVTTVVADREAEAFFSRSYHAVGVEALDVLGSVGDPGLQDAEIAARTAWFVGQFPGEDGRAGGIAGYDGFDVFLILGLCFRVVVPWMFQQVIEGQSHEKGKTLPLRVVADAGIVKVSCHATVVCPVVDKVDADMY